MCLCGAYRSIIQPEFVLSSNYFAAKSFSMEPWLIASPAFKSQSFGVTDTCNRAPITGLFKGFNDGLMIQDFPLA